MKNSVLILGVALVLFSSNCNAKSTVKLSDNLFQNIVFLDNNPVKESVTPAKIEKPSISEDLEVFNPESVIANNPKALKEIIAEGDKITENPNTEEMEFLTFEVSMKEIIAQSDMIIENTVSDQRFPLYVERTAEDEIAEMELIIESKENNEAYALDFKKINRIPTLINSFVSKKVIGMN